MDDGTAGDVVLTGRHAGLDWQVVVQVPDEDPPGDALLTLLELRRNGGLVASSGFDGPALPDGQLVSEWRGRTNGYPWFVMVRTAASVVAVESVTELGTVVQLGMTAVVPAYGLRFAAAGLPEGEAPALLRISTEAGRSFEVRAPARWLPEDGPEDGPGGGSDDGWADEET